MNGRLCLSTLQQYMLRGFKPAEQETPSSSVMLREGFQMKLIFELKKLEYREDLGGLIRMFFYRESNMYKEGTRSIKDMSLGRTSCNLLMLEHRL